MIYVNEITYKVSTRCRFIDFLEMSESETQCTDDNNRVVSYMRYDSKRQLA